MNTIIHYKHGHLCKPNGVGDYTFVCPKDGERAGFVPFMYRSLLSGFCGCGLQIELDSQPKVANVRGALSPCPSCGSTETNMLMTEHYVKSSAGKRYSFSRIAECLDCGHSTGHVPANPPYVFSDAELANFELAWSTK
jgi:hypothetical protein